MQTVALVMFGIVAFCTLFVFQRFFSVWLRCWLSGCPVAIPVLMAMRLRATPIEKITEAYVRTWKHGIKTSIVELEVEYIKDPRNFDTYVSILIEEHKKIRGEASGNDEGDASNLQRK